MRISVIIPCYNAAGTLGECLAAVARERRSGAPIAEVIVVDDASTDGSRQIAAGAEGVRLLALERNGGDCAARNAGARAATGEILWFLDADVTAAPGSARIVAEFLTDRADVDAVIGSYDDRPAAAGFCSQYRNLLHHYVHQRQGPSVSTFWTGCGAVRRAAFERLGGFDDSFWPGAPIADMEFGYRLRRGGGRIALRHDLLVRHHKRWTLGSIVRTDLFGRAIPWTVLLQRYPELGRGELNLGWREKGAVASVAAGVAAGAAACAAAVFARGVGLPLMLPASGCALFAVMLHAPILAFLQEKKGIRFALGSLLLLLIYDATCAVGYLAGRVCHALGYKPRRKSA